VLGVETSRSWLLADAADVPDGKRQAVTRLRLKGNRWWTPAEGWHNCVGRRERKVGQVWDERRVERV